ncbi:hypothetical protein F2Q69_00013400 [Brassica cretica]|uniref:Uncharacterized protein n=1 Tax=Brassica cretica TaxID=69181 RepID=A0A8S9QVG6_BRACR|nr:hypothetical protein F2Q69_00013400 [Brassica cretica]
MWTVWSLENDLVTRRLHEDPGIIKDGGTNALLGSLDRVWNPEESGDSLIRSGDRGLNPEVSVIGPRGQSYYAFEGVLEPGGLDPEIVVGTRRFFEVVMTPMRPRLHRDQGLAQGPGVPWEPEMFYFSLGPYCLPRQDYYRKSLTGLEGAGVGVMTQVPGFRCFPRLEKQDLVFTLVLWGPRCALGCTAVLGSFDSLLRLAHTHSCFMSHTRFDSLWACHCGHATFVRVGQDRRSLET